MMERSSRFISLSGLSGISAGICALAGTWFALQALPPHHTEAGYSNSSHQVSIALEASLLRIAILVFVCALASAFLFTYLRSKKTKVPIWGTQAQRLMVNLFLPLAVGGLFIIKLIFIEQFGLIAPACLIFYGLALLNASKYTLKEIRHLAIVQLALGVVNCWFVGYGLYFWAAGFGLAHIAYGAIMWWKYEKQA
jgi:hypothetical protein